MKMHLPTTKVSLLLATFVSIPVFLCGCFDESKVPMPFNPNKPHREILYPEGKNQDEFQKTYFKFVAPYYTRAIQMAQNAKNIDDCFNAMIEGYRGPTNAMVEFIRSFDDYDCFSHICEYASQCGVITFFGNYDYGITKEEKFCPEYKTFWQEGDKCFDQFLIEDDEDSLFRLSGIPRRLAKMLHKQAKVALLIDEKYGEKYRARKQELHFLNVHEMNRFHFILFTATLPRRARTIPIPNQTVTVNCIQSCKNCTTIIQNIVIKSN